jgi:hypothetical protein
MPKVTLIQEPIDYDNICPIVYALSIIGQKLEKARLSLTEILLCFFPNI